MNTLGWVMLMRSTLEARSCSRVARCQLSDGGWPEVTTAQPARRGLLKPGDPSSGTSTTLSWGPGPRPPLSSLSAASAHLSPLSPPGFWDAEIRYNYSPCAHTSILTPETDNKPSTKSAESWKSEHIAMQLNVRFIMEKIFNSYSWWP